MEEERSQIIRCTMKLFAEKGMKFTMQDICDNLHIAKKTIYHYYPSKEDLLIGVLDYGFAEIQQKKKTILQSGLPADQKIREVMIAMPDQYSVFDFRQLNELKEKYPDAYRHLNRHLESDWEPIIAFIEQGKKEGVIRNINISVLRMIVTASIEAFLSGDGLMACSIGYQDALEEMMDIIMYGIKRRNNEDY